MLWKPDTCECQLEYDGINDNAHFIRHIKICSAHQTVLGTNLSDTIISENQNKNFTLAKVSEFLKIKVDAISFFFGDDRILHIVSPNEAAKAGLRTLVGQKAIID